jgi:hypothetical protein
MILKQKSGVAGAQSMRPEKYQWGGGAGADAREGHRLPAGH